MTDNFIKYGVLYTAEAAQISCPAGWHLPTDDEWRILEKSLGMSTTDADQQGWGRYSGEVGRKLKSTTGWTNNGNGNNSSGFNALPAGKMSNGTFSTLGSNAFFYTATANDLLSVYFRSLAPNLESVYRYVEIISFGYSVRCLKDIE